MQFIISPAQKKSLEENNVKPLILVTTAVGKTGLPTAMQLLDMGFPVRALVRTKDVRTKPLEQAGAELVTGDLGEFADLQAAMQGVQRAYFTIPPGSNGLYTAVNFAIAAQEAGLEHVMFLGQWLAHPEHPSYATRQVWMAEKLFRWMPDVGVTLNSVGWFADNYMLVLPFIAQLGLMPMPLGDGTNAPPSNEDIALVNSGVLADPLPHAGKMYRPTGPKLMTPRDIAAVFARILNRRVRYVNTPDWLFEKAMKAQGLSPFFMTQLRYYVYEYQRNTFGLGAPTDHVRQIGGREPEHFESIVKRYVDSTPGVRRSTLNWLGANAGFMKYW